MTEPDFDSEHAYRDDRFTAVEVLRDDQLMVVCGFIEPGQFIPVHALSSTVAIHVRSGIGVVRVGDEEHRVEAGDVVTPEANADRWIEADPDTRLEIVLVVSPPPTNTEHEQERDRLYQNVFDPRNQ